MAVTDHVLGDKIKPELPAGWLVYIHKTYPNGHFTALTAAVTVGEDTLVLGDHHRALDALCL